MPFVTDPLTGEELDSGELDYRNQLRDALTSGQLKGQPDAQGNWNLEMGDGILPSAQPQPELPPAPEPPAPNIEDVQPPLPSEPKPEEMDAGTAAGLTNTERQSFDQDYMALTQNVTSPFGPDANKLAEVVWRGVQHLDDTKQDMETAAQQVAAAPEWAQADLMKQLQAQANRPTDRQVALDAFKEGLEATGDAQQAYDHMLAIAKDNFGNANPNVLQIAEVAAALGPGLGLGVLRGGGKVAAYETAVGFGLMVGSEPAANAVLPEDTPDWVRSLVINVGSMAPFTIPSSGLTRGFLMSAAAGAATTAAQESGIPEGPVLPGVGNLRDITANIGTIAVTGHLIERWDAVAAAMKSGTPRAEFGISPETARALQMSYDRVKMAAPDDLVTVYHGTDIKGAESIQNEGFRPGGYLTTDPEVAQNYAMIQSRFSNQEPQIVAFQVPRRLINEAATIDGTAFTNKELIQPTFNTATNGWIDNAGQVVKDWVQTQGRRLGSERGSFKLTDNDPIPDDVAALAFGSPEDHMPDAFRAEAAADRPGVVDNGQTVRRTFNPNLPDDYIERQFTIKQNGLVRAQAAYDKALERLESGRSWLDDNPEAYNDLTPAERQRFSVEGNTRALDYARQALYRALTWTQQYGEELYARTNGAKGLAPKMRNAIKQFLTEEQGAVRIPGAEPPNVYVNPRDYETSKASNPGLLTPRVGNITVRGTPIPLTDARIPDVVYHVTTNVAAVKTDSMLRAGGVGGLGGDSTDRIVSFTVDPAIAKSLEADLKLSASLAKQFPITAAPFEERKITIGKAPTGPGPRETQSNAIRAVLEKEAEKQGFKLDVNDHRYSPNWDVGDHLRQFFMARESQLGTANPLIFTSPEDLARIDPANVGIIEINKKNLDTGALVTNFDLDARFGLKEIRVYGDVPVGNAFFRSIAGGESGAFRFPDLQALAKSGQYKIGGMTAPGVTRLLGDLSVDPHLRPVDIVGNAMRDTFNPVGVLGSIDSDPLGTQIILQDQRARERWRSVSNAFTAEVSYYQNTLFKPDKDGFLLEFKKSGNDLTFQDLLDKHNFYKNILSPEQNYAIQRVNDFMKQIEVAHQQLGIPLDTRPAAQRPDVYFPRGDSFEDGFDYKEDGAKIPRGKKTSKGYEKGRVYDTMAEGIHDGNYYLPLDKTTEIYLARVGDRLLNAHWANVLRNVRDEHGNLIATSAEDRLAQTQIKKDVDALRKQVASLDKSLDKLDIRIHREIKKFLNSPDPDLTALKTHLDAISTKNKQLRVRVDKTAPFGGDIRRNFYELHKEVDRQLFIARGHYKGMTGEAARKAMLKDAIDNVSIGRGRFKGVDFEQGQQILEGIKARLKQLEPHWAATKKMAMAPGRSSDMGSISSTSRFGQNLQGVQFPKALSSAINDYFDGLGPTMGKDATWVNVANRANDLLRVSRATLDASFMFIQGQLGLVHEPDAWRHAMGGAIQAMTHPVSGKYVLGKYIADFNAAAAAKGLPSAQEWAARGLHVGGIETEYTSAAGLGRLPPVRLANQGFGYFGDILRLDGAQKILERNLHRGEGAGGNNPNERRTVMTDKNGVRSVVDVDKLMRDLSNSQNLMTGYSPNKFGGNIGSLAFFAPRYFGSQFELIARSLTDRSMTGVQARAMLRNLIGTGLALTVAANTLNDDPTFDWYHPFDNRGRLNSNFMRMRVPGVGDVSVFGPWDSLVKATVSAATGDPNYILRSKSSPLVGLLWDQMAGETFTGKHVPQVLENVKDVGRLLKSEALGTEFQAEGDWSPAVWGDYFMRSFLPFTFAEQVPDLIAGNTTPETAVTQMAVSSTGLKSTPPSSSEKVALARNEITQILIDDGTISADMAGAFKSMSYFELPSAMQKFIDTETQKRYPELYKEWQKQKVDKGNVFTERKIEADLSRAEYKAKYDGLLDRLVQGDNPYEVWDAYDTYRKQLQGALGKVYGDPNHPEYMSKEVKAYRQQIDALPISDMRRLEDAYNQIPYRIGKPVEEFTPEDWDTVDQLQQRFRSELPSLLGEDKAKIFEYNLSLKDTLNLESQHPLQVLRKRTQEALGPYYNLKDAVAAGEEDESALSQWLRDNPQADYLRWLTQKPTTRDAILTLHSVEAAETAMNVFGDTKREIRLVGSKQKVTAENLTTYQQYANEIKQIYETPARTVSGTRTAFPRTELRKQSALYDALYFWLGMSSPQQGELTIPVYHLDAVKKYLELWGPRPDGVLPKSSGGGY